MLSLMCINNILPPRLSVCMRNINVCALCSGGVSPVQETGWGSGPFWPGWSAGTSCLHNHQMQTRWPTEQTNDCFRQ